MSNENNYNPNRQNRGRVAFNSTIQFSESASDITPEQKESAQRQKAELIKKTKDSL